MSTPWVIGTMLDGAARPECGCRLVYLEGHVDLVSRLIMGITGFIIWLKGVINLLTKSP